MRRSLWPLSVPLLLLLLFQTRPIHGSSSSSADFSAYPSSARSCLSQAHDRSDCGSDTVTETNECLCSNGGDFVTSVAACIGTADGGDVLMDVYTIMEDSCTETKTPLDISQTDFIQAANATIVTTSTVTSTITATAAAGVLTTFTTTAVRTSTLAAITSASSSSSSSSNHDDDNDDDDSDDDDDDDDNDSAITLSAKVGAISASVVGVLMIACMACLVVLLKKRKEDKELLQRVQNEARGHPKGGYHRNSRGGDNPLLDASLPGSPTAGYNNNHHHHQQQQQQNQFFGASVTPPTPSYPGPTSSSPPPPQRWRSASQSMHNHGHGHGGALGTAYSPSELPSEGQWSYEMYDSSSNAAGGLHSHPANQQLSPVSQGTGTMGSWCPSPISTTVSSSAALGRYAGLAATAAAPTTTTTTTTATTATTAMDTLSPTSATTRSSWAHNNRGMQNEPYELPGTEVHNVNALPVEADSHPITRVPERLSLTISQAPPEYTPGGWIDPITDKPPPPGMI